MIRLNITMQSAKLEYSINRGNLDLKTTQPKLETKLTPARLDISQPLGELSIDQSPCRATLGIKDQTTFLRDIAQAGLQAVAEATARIAQNGDRMMHIESGENAVANIAAEETRPKQREIGLAYLARPEIHYVVKPPQIDYIPSEVRANLIRGTVENNTQRTRVEFYTSQYSGIQFSTSGSAVNVLT